MEHRRRLPDVLGCVDDVDYHTVASTPYTAALARSSCVWAPSLSATHRGAQPAPCRRSSPGGVLPSAAASARHRRPPRPDRQPSPGCVDRGVLAGACGLTPAPAGAARVRVRSHSSAGLRPNRGSLWPQRRWPRLLHTASGRGKRRCGPWLASTLPQPLVRTPREPRRHYGHRRGISFPMEPYQNAARMSRVRPRGEPPKRRDQAGLAALAAPKTRGGECCPPVRRTQEGAPVSANAHEQGGKCSRKKLRAPSLFRRPSLRPRRQGSADAGAGSG